VRLSNFLVAAGLPKVRIDKEYRVLFRWKFGAPILECYLNGILHGLAVELKLIEHHAEVIKIFHTAVCHAGDDHRLEFFRSTGLAWIPIDMRCGEIEKKWVFQFFRRGCNDIRKTNINMIR
jgi:hypothetical protein